MKYNGTFQELKALLSGVLETDKWQKTENIMQCPHKDGGLLSWNMRTCELMFIGNESTKLRLKAEVIKLLRDNEKGIMSNTFQYSKMEDVKGDGDGHPVMKPSRLADSFVSWDKFEGTELVLGITAAVGTDTKFVVGYLEIILKSFGYATKIIKVSREVISQIVDIPNPDEKDEYKRISELMNAGNRARELTENNAILSSGAAFSIWRQREDESMGGKKYRLRTAYIIDSLKRPEEVNRLRKIYPLGFFLLGIYEEESRRIDNLTTFKQMTEENAVKLIRRDENESQVRYGQRLTDTFHMSDFFVRRDHEEVRLRNSLSRIMNIVFGEPHNTPTFDEHAMFMAFAASLRSGDLSRQVGAVISVGEEIVSTGSNDVPKFGGGLYSPVYDGKGAIVDSPKGRDYTRGIDANKAIKDEIINEILDLAEKEKIDRAVLENVLSSSGLNEITEFGRAVHAEMEALLYCSRNNINARGGTLYCTTFPCHNCTKHIIAAGIHRVVFIEPYQKSRAFQLHDDAISMNRDDGKIKVLFESFNGIGPRRFFDLFSIGLGSGYKLVRKHADGKAKVWSEADGILRLPMLHLSYLDLEALAGTEFESAIKTHNPGGGNE